jgi:hypothetical protein
VVAVVVGVVPEGLVGCVVDVVLSATGTSFFTSWLLQAATSTAMTRLKARFFMGNSW